MTTDPKVVYEFGPFRVDPEKQVLLRENQPVAVTPKAFETLLVLVRHSREVVSKDQLMKAIWPDAFVEEANLSQNIFMLRKALGDTPEDKRYIVTIPGRGYRFAVPVRMVTADNEDLVIASRSRSQMVIEETETAPLDAVKALPARLPRTASWKYILPISVVVVLLVLSAGFFLRRHQPILLGEKDSVLIADFTNTTGDPVFDGTLRQGLAVQLEQSPLLSLVSEERIQRALRLMGQPPDAGLSGQTVRDLCQRTGSAVVLEGSIATLGNQYVLGLQATNCRNGDILDQEQVQTTKKEDVLNALTRIASKFRTRIGESLIAVEKHDTPLAEATTPSLEALKAYSMGWKVLASEGEAAAIPFFKHAIEIDPRFAAAYASLGVMYSSMGDAALASESASKAYELRDRASDNEKFFITAYYDGRVTGNQEKAQQTCDAWAQAYPREFMPHSFLSGFIYPGLAKYEQAMQEAQKNIELAPDQGVGYVNLGYISVFLGRLGEADDALRRASEHKIEGPLVSLLQYDVAFSKGDVAGMQREVDAARGKSGAEDWISDHQAFALAYSGQLQEARQMSGQARDLAQQAAHRERAALFETRVALWDAFFGNGLQARRSAMAALHLGNNREVTYGVAFALALSGDSSQSQTLVNDLEKQFPEDTSVRFNYVPAVRGLIAINQGVPSKAIELLQVAVPYELGTPRSSLQGFFGALYPVYVRGQAYLAAHQGPKPPGNSKKSLTIAELRSAILSVCWPISASPALILSQAKPPRLG
jgi:eukaryotic-like serine/threonine-protein kinase